MSDFANRSKVSMGSAKRINQKLERDLLMKTKVMNKNLELIEKERMGIVATRRNINEERISLGGTPDISRLSMKAINSSDERRGSLSLSQSKFMLNAAIEKAKKYNFLPPGIGDSDNCSKKTDVNNNNTSLPFVTQPLSSCITETALENQKEIGSCEKVLRYIQMQHSEANDSRAKPNTVSCRTPYPVLPARENCDSKNEDSGVDKWRRAVVNLMSKATTFYDDSSQTPVAKQKIVNRRHSVLGVTLNVPIIISQPCNNRPLSRFRTNYSRSAKEEPCIHQVSVGGVNNVVSGEENDGKNISQEELTGNRRKSLPCFLPVPPNLTKTKTKGRQRSRRSSLPNIDCTSPTLLCMQRIRDSQGTATILEEFTDEDLSQHNAFGEDVGS